MLFVMSDDGINSDGFAAACNALEPLGLLNAAATLQVQRLRFPRKSINLGLAIAPADGRTGCPVRHGGALPAVPRSCWDPGTASAVPTG